MIQRCTDFASDDAIQPTGRLSYKFQRLREQLRDAIAREELHGKLPGERVLGRRFGVNAKTVNKALCDLAGEGILVRVIGCGTFVAKDRAASRAPGDRRMIHVLTGRRPAGGDDATAAQLAALSDAQDVDLETLAVYRTRHQDGEIPLIAWPPTDRRFARGVIVVPCRPLDDADVHPSPELISETWRRHTPLVVLGACPTSAKTYTVVPDFQDAGFQITNHLYHAGCQRIVVLVSDDAGRACRRALGGCQSAALRLGRPLSSVEVLRTDEVEPANGNGSGGAIPSSSDRMTGIWSFGSRAFDAMKRLLDRPMPTDAPGAVAFACLLEPGDERAAHANVTSYETSVESMAMWAIRLIHEAQPGQPPSEVLIPGDLCVRDRAGRDATLSGTNAAVAPRRMDPAIVC